MAFDLFTIRPAAARAVNPAVASLQGAMAKLSERDKETAASLLSAARRGALTDRQAAFAASLVARTKAPVSSPIAGMVGIVELLAVAGVKLKWPVIRFEAGGIRYRLGRSGAGSREPGSVSVTTDERGFSARTYFGRINLAGAFEPHHNQSAEAVSAVGAALIAFSAAPAEQARIYGQRFSRCCFCGLELTDKRSIDAGYGPICAENYGLPHG